MVIICIAGIPGSGKTYLADSMQKYTGGCVLDDIYSNNDLDEAISKNYKFIYVTSPYFIFKEARKRFTEKYNKCDIEWIYFENDIDKAYRNLLRRDDNRLITRDSLKHYWSRNYVIPEDIVQLKIYEHSKEYLDEDLLR